MWRRSAILLATLAIAFTATPFLPQATAQCSPTSGSSSNDLITCNGGDSDGVNTGSGNDQVNVLSGNVADTVISEGGALLIIVNGGSLDTSTKGTDAIRTTTSSSVEQHGDIVGGYNGILVLGNGQILVLGNIHAAQSGISASSGTVSLTGSILAIYSDGIHLDGAGDVSGSGKID